MAVSYENKTARAWLAAEQDMVCMSDLRAESKKHWKLDLQAQYAVKPKLRVYMTQWEMQSNRSMHHSKLKEGEGSSWKAGIYRSQSWDGSRGSWVVECRAEDHKPGT